MCTSRTSAYMFNISDLNILKSWPLMADQVNQKQGHTIERNYKKYVSFYV